MQGPKGNDKYVYEKIKKDINNLLVKRGLRPVDDDESRLSYDEFNMLLDELGFINLNKVHANENELVH